MCDYSLMNLPNRLANAGETLVTHKFPTGSIGFVSPEELRLAEPIASCATAGLWGIARAWFLGPPARKAVPTVCIPPGARLKVQSIPEGIRETLVAEPEEELSFTQITAESNRFRDALRTKSGQEILLQAIGVGLQIQVLSLTAGRPSATVLGIQLRRRPKSLDSVSDPRVSAATEAARRV